MTKRSSKGKKKEHDFAVTAFRVVREATGETDTLDESAPTKSDIGIKNSHAVALGRLGGKKGGKARAKKLTAEQRSAIARKAAAARWGPPRT